MIRPSLWLCALALASAAPAWAEGPEELEQLEPDGGQWQVEYYGIIGRGGGDSHAVQLLYGVSDRLAFGVELEGEKDGGPIEIEGIAPTLLWRFTDPEESPLGTGLELQAEFDGDARLIGVEARLIAERRRQGWWTQANGIVRHVREGGGSATGLAYAWSISRSIGADLWLGVEGAGQAGRIGGAALVLGESGHFVGPAVTIEREAGAAEVEIGLAWLRRIGGEGPPDSARLFVQLNF